MPWEVLAGTITRFEGPIRKPVEITPAGERSRVKDPVAGKEKEVHIVYPEGDFFWNDGKMATTEVMRASHGDLRLEWPNRLATAAEVNWTNQK
jgi:hypothetical protein